METKNRPDLLEQVQRYPYGALAAAAGIGYVLAGGLFTRLTARILKLGVRVAAPIVAWPLLEHELLELRLSEADIDQCVEEDEP
jgi:hypothetical protein